MYCTVSPATDRIIVIVALRMFCPSRIVSSVRSDLRGLKSKHRYDYEMVLYINENKQLLGREVNYLDKKDGTQLRVLLNPLPCC